MIVFLQVRPQLQTLMASVNRVLPEGCAEDMVQSLLNQIRTSKTDVDAARPSAALFSCIPRNLPTAAAQSDNACEIVKQFILANNSENIKMHPAFSRFIFLMKAAICTCPNNMSTCPSHAATSEPITLEDLFFFMSTALSDCVGAMVPTVALGANLVSDLIQSCEKQSAPAFPETIGFLLTTMEDCSDCSANSACSIHRLHRQVPLDRHSLDSLDSLDDDICCQLFAENFLVNVISLA